mmetsp:Transcript_28821/g.59151  ORF Transcript_28821/g.59151 Transcript_28821/m.59151 type:complete len:300 (+) Transcript_28821:1422-2321(+)
MLQLSLINFRIPGPNPNPQIWPDQRTRRVKTLGIHPASLPLGILGDAFGGILSPRIFVFGCRHGKLIEFVIGAGVGIDTVGVVDGCVRGGVGVELRWLRRIVGLIVWWWWSALRAGRRSSRRTIGMSVRRAMRRTIAFAVAGTVEIPSRRRRAVMRHAIGARRAIHHAVAKVTSVIGTSAKAIVPAISAIHHHITMAISGNVSKTCVHGVAVLATVISVIAIASVISIGIFVTTPTPLPPIPVTRRSQLPTAAFAIAGTVVSTSSIITSVFAIVAAVAIVATAAVVARARARTGTRTRA